MAGPTPDRSRTADELAAVVAERAVIVCAGAGGVGKTSVAAALAVEAAEQGRRAVVVTIDPARRLADALGLDGLSNDPHRIEGRWPGELHAVMLDTKATFDALVDRYAASPAQTERILRNRFYRNISHALSGTQEYMAAEKLYELHTDDRYELIVVDTPPTRQALDFLDAPRQLARFLDHRVYRLMTSSGRGVSGMLNKAGFTVLRTASRLVGASVMDDAIAFFTAFEGMEGGFRQRSAEVRALLVSPRAGFVVVTTAQRDTTAEAAFFLRRLRAEGVAAAVIVANRVTPRFSDRDAASLRRLAAEHRGDPLGALLANLARLTEQADEEDAVLDGLRSAGDPAPGGAGGGSGGDRAALVHRVALLDGDVHDLAGLDRLRSAIFQR
jgi:anion-transporting  ArsA/GET3 family ATPase